jgi:hypothetical protein
MPDLNAVLDQLKSAGITPQVQITLSPETQDIQQIKDLVEALKNIGITAEVHISLQVSAEEAGSSTPDLSQDKLKTFTVMVSDVKLNCMTFTRKDNAGKPIMEIHEPRIQLFKGARFQVSATHKASEKDPGDGTVIGTGGMKFYLVVDCPANRSAEGFYVRQSEVSRV